jgi:hypothetical protein
MQLDEFIQTALFQIASGVYKANVAITTEADPRGDIPFLMDVGGDGKVNFDVAVTTKSTIEGGGGGKFKIFVVEANTDGKGSYEHERVSRITFAVGVDQRLGYLKPGFQKT